MRKKSVLLLLVSLLVIIAVGSVSAYMADAKKKVNTFSIGYNEITTEEEFEETEKGKKTVKKPMARNTGSVDCYVRGKVLLSDSRADDYFEYYCEDVLGFNTQDWVEADDGWMYYTSVLKVGEKTSPVFTHIKLSALIPDALLDFTIDVVFESVQSNDFENAQDAFSALSKGGGL